MTPEFEDYLQDMLENAGMRNRGSQRSHVVKAYACSFIFRQGLPTAAFSFLDPLDSYERLY